MLSVEEMAAVQPERYPRNDIGSASLFHCLYCRMLRYVPERRAFLYYSGKYWKKDMDDLQAHEFAKDFALSMLLYGRSAEIENKDEFIRYYMRYMERSRRKRLIADSKGIWPLALEELDRQPYLFNCQNGTLDLAMGTFHPHTPEDYLSRISNVWYEPKAKSVDWLQFIDEIMMGDQELIAYLQKCLGYSISAATFQECFFVAYGKTTRNGKGTLDSTIQHLLGDYARAAEPSTFESKKYRNGSGGENVARLAGARYVSVYEPAEGMVLDSALIKALSGNDKITARFLYENSFEFVSSFKIWFFTNHLPNITDDTVFRSGRVMLIPFRRHFREDEQDRGLKARLRQKENLSGVLNWCMEGFQKMALEGCLKAPEMVKREVEKYRQDNDRLGEFLEECFRPHSDGPLPSTRIRLSAIYQGYCRWCQDNHYRVLSRKVFNEKLEERVPSHLYDGVAHVYGLEIQDPQYFF